MGRAFTSLDSSYKDRQAGHPWCHMGRCKQSAIGTVFARDYTAAFKPPTRGGLLDIKEFVGGFMMGRGRLTQTSLAIAATVRRRLVKGRFFFFF